MQPNPFNPSFGGKPQFFFGRQRELDLVASALQNQYSPYRTLFLTGNRGCGKTALLERLSQLAGERQWLCIDVHSANASEAIVRKLTHASSSTTIRSVEPSVAGVKVGGSSASKTVSYDALDLSEVLLDTCEGLASKQGVFITIDEVQKIPEPDIENICAAVQMSMRKGMPVALMMAGLPGTKEQVASFPGCTFMQRVTDIKLDSLLVDETYQAFEYLLANASDLDVRDGAVDEMAHFSQGYPYLMQLIGYHAVEVAHSSAPVGLAVLDKQAVEGSQLDAYLAFRDNVLEPVVRPLGVEQRAYLTMMEQVMDREGKASTGEVASLMGKTQRQLSSLRAALIEKRIVVADGRGFVRYNLPLMRRYFSDEALVAEPEPNNVWKHE